MPWFTYKALDKNGAEQSGTEEAESRGALTAALRERGLFVTEAKEGAKPAPAQPARAAAPEPPPPVHEVAQPAPARQGPPAPGMCPSCRTPKSLKEFKKLPNQGLGCLLCVIGVCLTPVLIGIPIALYGFELGGRAEIKAQCSHCGWQGVPIERDRLTVRIFRAVLYLFAAVAIITLLIMAAMAKFS